MNAVTSRHNFGHFFSSDSGRPSDICYLCGNAPCAETLPLWFWSLVAQDNIAATKRWSKRHAQGNLGPVTEIGRVWHAADPKTPQPAQPCKVPVILEPWLAEAATATAQNIHIGRASLLQNSHSNITRSIQQWRREHFTSSSGAR